MFFDTGRLVYRIVSPSGDSGYSENPIVVVDSFLPTRTAEQYANATVECYKIMADDTGLARFDIHATCKLILFCQAHYREWSKLLNMNVDWAKEGF